jgi:putative transposase
VVDQRKGAAKQTPRKLTPAEQERIVSLCCSKPYQDLTPHQIVPILAEKGTYIASESSFYRVLRQQGLLVAKKPRQTRGDTRPDELKATAVNQLWSWDISYLKTEVRGRYFYLYLFMDIFSRAIMGWEIHESESGETSSNLFARICAQHKAQGVTLHSDNGGPMRSSHMLATLQQLGVVASFSRPSVSNDNAFSESLFKTIKYTAGYPKSFKTIDEARAWMSRFTQWYNHEHRHSRIQYVTPMQRHTGHDQDILAQRKQVYAQARLTSPSRWTNQHHSWQRPDLVYLKRPNHPSKKSA